MARKVVHEYERLVVVRLHRAILDDGSAFDRTLIDADVTTPIEVLGVLELAKQDRRFSIHPPDALNVEGDLDPFPAIHPSVLEEDD